MQTRQTDRSGPEATADELRRTRRELRLVENRFRSIIEKTADGVLVVSDDGIIRFANAAAGRLWGRDARELVGGEFGHPVVVGEATEIDIAAPTKHIVAELRVMETVWEGVEASIISLRDITDRKEAEERERRLLRERIARAEAEDAARRSEFLSEASRRLSSDLDVAVTLQTLVSLIVEDFADFCVLDLVEDGAVRRFTAACDPDAEGARLLKELASFPLDTTADTPQARVYRERRPIHVREVSEDWLREATTGEDHLDLARRLGAVSLVFVPLHAGRECLGVLTAGHWTGGRSFDGRDFRLAIELGERAALAIDNARLYEQAQAANQAKANFLSVMSHELRTPLSAITGYADLMERRLAGEVTDRQVGFLRRIRASSGHLLQIIEEILAFASSEAGDERIHPERATVEEIMDDVLGVIEPLARASPVDLELEVRDADFVLVTDTRKLRQILVNLVSNAFKFTRQGKVRLRVAADGDDAVFVVEDTGPGIPEDQLEKIFERFWQGEDPMTRRAGGTGLGLAVARSFAGLLGGTLEVRSVVGEGSVFTLRVPRELQ